MRRVKTEQINKNRNRQEEKSLFSARIDLSQTFDFSKIPERKRHLYVCCIVLLLILLAHVIKSAA